MTAPQPSERPGRRPAPAIAHPVALVTGAGPGLGGALALGLAEAGARLVICDIDAARLKDTEQRLLAQGAEVLSRVCDVSDSAAVDELVAEAARHFGTVHVLVNNAAVIPARAADQKRRSEHYAYLTTPQPRRSLGFTVAMTDEEWLRFWNVNVHGVFYCTRAVLRLMEPQHYGRIINIASVAGISAMSMHSPHYSATKGAVVAFTKAVAAEVAGANIFVNAIAPGGVHTPDFEAYLQALDEEGRNRFWQLIPAGRLGTMDDYAATVVHLACDPHYLVGQIISPNGGCVI
jgi:3-oxoacyl-[acyl-carrier protein] reductase